MSKQEQNGKGTRPVSERDQQLSEQELEQINGGWGKKTYYSYSEGQTASYTSSSSDTSKS